MTYAAYAIGPHDQIEGPLNVTLQECIAWALDVLDTDSPRFEKTPAGYLLETNSIDVHITEID